MEMTGLVGGEGRISNVKMGKWENVPIRKCANVLIF